METAKVASSSSTRAAVAVGAAASRRRLCGAGGSSVWLSGGGSSASVCGGGSGGGRGRRAWEVLVVAVVGGARRAAGASARAVRRCGCPAGHHRHWSVEVQRWRERLTRGLLQRRRWRWRRWQQRRWRRRRRSEMYESWSLRRDCAGAEQRRVEAALGEIFARRGLAGYDEEPKGRLCSQCSVGSRVESSRCRGSGERGRQTQGTGQRGC